MLSSIRSSIWLAILLALTLRSQSPGAARSTLLGDIASGVADRLNEYAAEHNGAVPRTWEDLAPYLDIERLERNIGGPLAKKMLLLAEVHPSLPGVQPGQLVAMTAFPIEEDRRGALGRYVVYRRSDNRKFSARWETEVAIQSSFFSANLAIPAGAVFREKPMLQFDPSYGYNLIQDGLKHGVPLEQVVGAVENHISKVTRGESKPTAKWSDINVSSDLGTSPATQFSSVQQVQDQHSPGIPNAANSLETHEGNTVIVISGILAILITGCAVLYLRRKRPKP